MTLYVTCLMGKGVTQLYTNKRKQKTAYFHLPTLGESDFAPLTTIDSKKTFQVYVTKLFFNDLCVWLKPM